MTSAEHSPLTRKLSAFVALSEVELVVLERLHERRRSFVAGRDMVHQGQSAQAAYILSSGWVCSYKLQADGTRQIVDFQVPGDFLDCAASCCARRITASNLSSTLRPPTCWRAIFSMPSRGRRASRPPYSGQRQGTKRWSWSISSGSVGVMRRPNGAFPARTGIEACAGWNRQQGRIRLPSDAIPPRRYAGVERVPCETASCGSFARVDWSPFGTAALRFTTMAGWWN